MSKISFIGAGSTVFTRTLLQDIFAYPELADVDIALYDIDAQRLDESKIVADHLAREQGIAPRIRTHLNRQEALADADYVITLFQIGGYEPGTVTDFAIPKQYGLRQTIGDTLGIGGIMRGLRTIDVLQEMAADMVAVCPDTLHLNYANPMAMNCWALNRSSPIRTVGLCHSVPHTAGELATDLGIPAAEIDYLAAGINHMAFYLKLEHNGRDLYPDLHQVIADGKVPKHNQVRYDMLQRLGYFVTESSEHFSEYVPWFIKRDRPDLIEKYQIPLDEYLRRCDAQIAFWGFVRDELLAGNGMPFGGEQGVEYAPQIIHSIETNRPRTIYGNVANKGLIDNLPADCCVELPCRVDGTGITPQPIGKLPPHLAALMQTNINVQAMTVEAALTGKREHIYHAAMLDPHTAAELDLDQIWSLVDQLLAAHAQWLPRFNSASKT